MTEGTSPARPIDRSIPRPTRLLIGSANPGKVAEYRRLLAGLDLELVSPDELDPVPPEPPESGETFAENAMAKARAYAQATGLAAVADDSGLLVEALRGAPGLRSRRFFGPDTTAEERNARLLSLLEGANDRRARFVCLVALAVPSASSANTHRSDATGGRSAGGKDVTTGGVASIELFGGEVHGEIADAPRGEQGFGYDPIFVITRDGRTMAELGPEEKDRVSHRGLAVAKLRARLSAELR